MITHPLPTEGDELRLTDGTTARVLHARYDEHHAPDLAGKWQVTGPGGARLVDADDIVGYVEDDQTAAASRARVELPGVDHTHVTANLINAAITLEQVRQKFMDDGTMRTNAARIKAEDDLRVATRAYMRQVNA